MSNAWKTGSTRRWREIRSYVLARDRWKCQIQGNDCTKRATEVDHIIRREDGGTDGTENLRAACGKCNRGRERERVRIEPPPRRVTNW